jgi:O-antigen ligase
LRDPGTRLLLFYSLVVIASSVQAYSPRASIHDWYLYFSWVMIYLLIANIVTTEQRFFVFLLSFLLYNMKMSLHGTKSWIAAGFGFDPYGVTGAPGWFQNSGEFGIEMTMFLPLSIFFIVAMWRSWGWLKRAFFLAMPVTALLGMTASSSRGALLGAAAAGLWFMVKSRYKVRALILSAVLAVGVVTIMPDRFKQRFNEAGTDRTSQTRLQYWKDGIQIANQYPVLGIGYGNWLAYYLTRYNPAGQLPHNIFIQAWAEMGYVGLTAFLLLIAATFVLNYRTRNLASRMPGGGRFLFYSAHGLDGALVGFLVSGFFVTVLYYPFFWINLAMTVALHAAARREAARAATGDSTGNITGPLLHLVPRSGVA